MIYEVLADIIVVMHFAWILFILTGFILTITGFWWKKFFDKWLFRTIHLGCVLYLSILDIMGGKPCPLTIWENILRAKYDPNLTYPGSFIAHYIGKLVYPDINPSILLISYIFIYVFTIIIFIVKPPSNIKGILFR